MLQLNNVSKCYPCGNKAISNISFNLALGEMLFLTGHSGAGKSTLLKIIAKLETYTQGQILFNNKNLNQISNKQIPYYRRNIGVIFQTPQLLTDRNVFNNVALPLVINNVSHKDLANKVYMALDNVSLLGKEFAMVNQLSGGEQQRVGIARAIVHSPLLLLADEPTGNLDPELSKDIMDLFVRLNNSGVSSIIASHNLSLINQYPFKQIQLKQGEILV
jgi:cell division transport system ATP-binding protein